MKTAKTNIRKFRVQSRGRWPPGAVGCIHLPVPL